MGSEVPNSDSGWDYPLTDEDLRAIDSAFAAAAASAPPPKRHALSYSDEENSSVHFPPKHAADCPNRSLFSNNSRTKTGHPYFFHLAPEIALTVAEIILTCLLFEIHPGWKDENHFDPISSEGKSIIHLS
ncbi:UNVERIFIED_CONTAM: hypothetical protein Slati_1177600 [Sesamum latifolium]|uniref:Uncharacterized protein n=1 Tax=Sesamum latifolium TaxID=2727402 RepID=A0AAW2XJB3_9LAMI